MSSHSELRRTSSRSSRAQDLGRLAPVGLGVGVDLLAREHGPRRRAPGGVAHARGVVADDQHDDVAGVLELAQLRQHDGVAEVDVGRGRVEPELDAQRAALREALRERALRAGSRPRCGPGGPRSARPRTRVLPSGPMLMSRPRAAGVRAASRPARRPPRRTPRRVRAARRARAGLVASHMSESERDIHPPATGQRRRSPRATGLRRERRAARTAAGRRRAGATSRRPTTARAATAGERRAPPGRSPPPHARRGDGRPYAHHASARSPRPGTRRARRARRAKRRRPAPEPRAPSREADGYAPVIPLDRPSLLHEEPRARDACGSASCACSACCSASASSPSSRRSSG